MNGKKRNFYNVYKDNELILSDVTNIQASEVSGCNKSQISTYANGINHGAYGGKDGVYRFETSKTEMSIPKTPNVKTVKEHDTPMTAEQIKERNDIRAAAKLLKTGKGRIVELGHRKYVVAK